MSSSRVRNFNTLLGTGRGSDRADAVVEDDVATAATTVVAGPSRRELTDAWLADYELNHRRHRWNRSETQGDPAVRTFFEAVRDELRSLGVLANVGPVLGAIYVVDAVREKPGFVIWSIYADSGKWSGSLIDAREINLQGTGTVPGAAEAYSSIGPPPSGFFNTLALGGMYRKRQSGYASVYGRGGTGIEVLDYPDKMFDVLAPDFTGVDVYNPRAVAEEMLLAMRDKKITFSGTSNITKADRAGQGHSQKPVEVTAELIERWRELGRDGGSWKCKRVGGSPFNMPAPV